jgi:hypothetical protein
MKQYLTISGIVQSNLIHFIIRLTEFIVFVSISFAMIAGTLALPQWLGGDLVSITAGWILLITTLLSAIISIVNTFRSIIIKKSPFLRAVEADVFRHYQWLEILLSAMHKRNDRLVKKIIEGVLEEIEDKEEKGKSLIA